MLKKLLAEQVDKAIEALKKLIDGSPAQYGFISDLIREKVEAAKEKMREIMEKMSEKVQKAKEQLAELVKERMEAVEELVEIVAKEVAPELEKLKEAAIEQIRKIVEGLEAIIAQNKNSYGILDHITDAVKKFEEKAKEVISGL